MWVLGRRTAALLFLAGILSPLATGCGNGAGTLTGTVRYKGTLLTSGSVILYCDGQQMVRGNISHDGTYSITDVPRGRAVVTIKTHPRIPEGMRIQQKLPMGTPDAPRPPSEGDYSHERSVVIPGRYGTPEESGLVVTIGRKTQVFDIDLKP